MTKLIKFTPRVVAGPIPRVVSTGAAPTAPLPSRSAFRMV